MPQPALKSIVIPPDPLPVYRPFPENYVDTEPNYIATESAQQITTESGDNLIWESGDTLLPDPNNPVIYPTGTV